MEDKRKVILDNDFINYFFRTKGKTDIYFRKLIDELNVEPIVHTYVYNEEMLDSLLRKLVSDGLIHVMEYDDFLNSELDEQYYEDLFKDMYYYCNMERIVEQRFNVRKFRKAKSNIGEIHSVLLALFTGYELFLSNDRGSKSLAENKVNTDSYQLKVQNVMEVFREIALKENKVYTKKEFVTLTKGDKGRKEEIDCIKEMWIESQ